METLQVTSARVRSANAGLFTFASRVHLLDVFLQLQAGLTDHPVLLRGQERASGGDGLASSIRRLIWGEFDSVIWV